MTPPQAETDHNDLLYPDVGSEPRYHNTDAADGSGDSAFRDDAHYSEVEEDDDNDLDDQDDCTKCVLSLVALFAAIQDSCPMMTFFEAFRVAFGNLTVNPETSASHKVFYTSAARLLLASHLPRRMVLVLGGVIKVQEDPGEGEDLHDLCLVKEWDRLRLEAYQRAQQAKAEAEQHRYN